MKVKIQNKKRGEVLEVRIMRNGKQVMEKDIFPTQTCLATVKAGEKLEVRKLSAKTGRVKQAWKTVYSAPTRARTSVKKRKKNPCPAPRRNPKKKAAKKPVKKKAAAKPKRRRVTCSICGKKVANIFRHRWTLHRQAAKKSLKKAETARRKKGKKGKGKGKRSR